MPDLKLPKLPNRTPVKHTIVIMPELEKKLREYADLYRQSYGNAESVDTLIPFMLDAFLESDRKFTRMQKDKNATVLAKRDQKLRRPQQIDAESMPAQRARI